MRPRHWVLNKWQGLVEWIWEWYVGLWCLWKNIGQMKLYKRKLNQWVMFREGIYWDGWGMYWGRMINIQKLFGFWSEWQAQQKKTEKEMDVVKIWICMTCPNKMLYTEKRETVVIENNWPTLAKAGNTAVKQYVVIGHISMLIMWNKLYIKSNAFIPSLCTNHHQDV